MPQKKTHCVKGHPLDGPGSNVDIYHASGGRIIRRCRTCAKEYYQGNKSTELVKAQKTAQQIRYRAKSNAEALAHYGGECVCCGESNPLFLTFDHKNNDGGKHRSLFSRGMYSYFRMHGYPDDIQLMCFNCNCGRNRNGGICPHVGAVSKSAIAEGRIAGARKGK